MSKFLQFPGDMQGVKEALYGYPPFQGYPWIVYGETHRKLHLGFNGEDINLSLEWHAKGYYGGGFSFTPSVRIQVSLAQKRNPVPRAKGMRRKNYQIWIPSRHVDRFFAWDKTPVELPKVLLTMFNKEQKERLRAAYALLAEVFPPAIEHAELHTDTGGYDESELSSLITKEENLLAEVEIMDSEKRPDEKLEEVINQSSQEIFAKIHKIYQLSAEETEEELAAKIHKICPSLSEERIIDLNRHTKEIMPILRRMSRRSKSSLVETEEVNDSRWREICQWIDTEWEGGGWVNKDEDLTIFASRGTMSLKFSTYKHAPDQPRVLYMIHLNDPSLGVKQDLNLIFEEGTEIPAKLDDFLLLYSHKHKENYAFSSQAAAIRSIRKRIKTVRADEGYKSLAEVYEYVMHELRRPVSHGELHTDVSGYEEAVDESVIMEETFLKPEEYPVRYDDPHSNAEYAYFVPNSGFNIPFFIRRMPEGGVFYASRNLYVKSTFTGPLKKKGFKAFVTPWSEHWWKIEFEPYVPEHHELHTDTSEYGESIEGENLFAEDEQLTEEQLSALRALHAQWQREQWQRPQLKLTGREWRKLIPEYNENYRNALTRILKYNRAEVLSEEEPADPLKADRPSTMVWLFAWLRAKEILTHVEHEELHTDVGGYDESKMREETEEDFLTATPETIDRTYQWAKSLEDGKTKVWADAGRAGFYIKISSRTFPQNRVPAGYSMGNTMSWLHWPGSHSGVVAEHIRFGLTFPRSFDENGPLNTDLACKLTLAEADFESVLTRMEKGVAVKANFRFTRDKDVLRSLKVFRKREDLPRLAEIYRQVFNRLFEIPPEHHELHTDTSEYGENIRLTIDTDLTLLGE